MYMGEWHPQEYQNAAGTEHSMRDSIGQEKGKRLRYTLTAPVVSRLHHIERIRAFTSWRQSPDGRKHEMVLAVTAEKNEVWVGAGLLRRSVWIEWGNSWRGRWDFLDEGISAPDGESRLDFVSFKRNLVSGQCDTAGAWRVRKDALASLGPELTSGNGGCPTHLWIPGKLSVWSAAGKADRGDRLRGIIRRMPKPYAILPPPSAAVSADFGFIIRQALWALYGVFASSSWGRKIGFRW